MTETKKPRAIIYARLACQDNWTDTRLDSQVGVATKLANEHGLAIDNIIVEVASGSSPKQRPGLRTVLERVKSGLLSHVIVADVTRLLRGGKAADWRYIALAFEDGDVRLITPDGVFASGALALQFQGLDAGNLSGHV